MRAARTTTYVKPKTAEDLLDRGAVWAIGDAIVAEQRDKRVKQARTITYTIAATGALLTVAVAHSWPMLAAAVGMSIVAASISITREVIERRRDISPFEALELGVKATSFTRIEAAAIIPKKGYRLRLNPHAIVAKEAILQYTITRREWALIEALIERGFTGSVDDVVNAARDIN